MSLLRLLENEKTVWMGILNITPDSFSDGGAFFSPEKALSQALQLGGEGCHIIDVGAVSTKPGNNDVSADEEWSRLENVLPILRNSLPSHILLSLDTSSPTVAMRASAFIDLINDVYASRKIESNLTTSHVASQHKKALILMHMQGTPENMQVNPAYENCVEEVYAFLQERISFSQDLGVQNIIVDPGIGFGKSSEHNQELLKGKSLQKFAKLEVPVLVGLSRKRFLGEMYKIPEASERDKVSKEWEHICIENGVKIIRSHRGPLFKG